MMQSIDVKINIVMSDEVEYMEELGELGLKDQGDEVVVALWGGQTEKYSLKEEFDIDSISEFIEVSCIIVSL